MDAKKLTQFREIIDNFTYHKKPDVKDSFEGFTLEELNTECTYETGCSIENCSWNVSKYPIDMIMDYFDFGNRSYKVLTNFLIKGGNINSKTWYNVLGFKFKDDNPRYCDYYHYDFKIQLILLFIEYNQIDKIDDKTYKRIEKYFRFISDEIDVEEKQKLLQIPLSLKSVKTAIDTTLSQERHHRVRKVYLSLLFIKSEKNAHEKNAYEKNTNDNTLSQKRDSKRYKLYRLLFSCFSRKY